MVYTYEDGEKVEVTAYREENGRTYARWDKDVASLWVNSNLLTPIKKPKNK